MQDSYKYFVNSHSTNRTFLSHPGPFYHIWNDLPKLNLSSHRWSQLLIFCCWLFNSSQIFDKLEQNWHWNNNRYIIIFSVSYKLMSGFLITCSSRQISIKCIVEINLVMRIRYPRIPVARKLIKRNDNYNWQSWFVETICH